MAGATRPDLHFIIRPTQVMEMYTLKLPPHFMSSMGAQ